MSPNQDMLCGKRGSGPGWETQSPSLDDSDISTSKNREEVGSPEKRRAMTNLDIIFKSRDISLPTKVRLVKAMVFPVVMYGCESWTVKKAEC